MDVSSKVKEAETYLSMGLLEESLVVYEQILTTPNELDRSMQETIRDKVTELKAEIESFDQSE